MIIVDPGHKYLVKHIDVENNKFYYNPIIFVKRVGLNYPNNENSHSGIILQSLLRVCTHRLRFLQNQRWCLENVIIKLLLRLSLWLLEFRAARRHKYIYLHGLDFAEFTPMCEVCGHTFCNMFDTEKHT